MNHQSPEIGTYKVFSAYNELYNNKQMSVAEVQFMCPDRTEYDRERIKIRIRALYNEKSNGPKKHFTIEKLANKVLSISALHTHINGLEPSKKSYSIDWDILEQEQHSVVQLSADDPELLNIANAQQVANDTDLKDDIDDPEYIISEEFSDFLTLFNKSTERRF